MKRNRRLILSQSFSLGRQAALICKGKRGQRRAYRPHDREWELGYDAAGDCMVRRSVTLSPDLLASLRSSTDIPLTLAAELGLILAVIGGVREVITEGDRVAIVLVDGRKIEWSVSTNE